MAELTTLARPYARAAFEYADQSQALQSWADALSTLSAVVVDPAVTGKLSDPLATAEQKADVLISLVGDELDDGQKNYLRNLAENKRLALIPEIESLFATMKANREQTVDINITSARDLDDAQKQNLAKTLTRYLQRNVELQCQTDSKLLGGVMINAGDLLIDGSVKGRLTKLADAMNS